MTFDAFLHQLPDADAAETGEWLESLDSLVASEGTVRARFVIGKLLERARRLQVPVPSLVSTPYINTIPPDEEPWFPGDEEMERRIRRIVRWNAAAMVTRANKRSDGIGGHLSTYASAASLYEVGFNHFFRGKDDGTSGDQIYYQGHAAPGMYSHAYLEGRITEAQMDNFRQETGGNGLSSYPHPRLMPEFWEFPTVSMGLGPLNAIYQARFNRYLYNRHIADTSESRVWCFLGDGECDEPETLGALSLAAREQLDNLTFVVNCNLQRLDGPVRGNGKVIQELEGIFRGAGWNVIKVIWAREWDELLARDVHGVLVDQMNRVPDGEFQKYATETGAYIREHFFGPDPRLRKMVEHLSDDDLRHLRRGGHDYRKVYSAYKLALEQHGAPTVILAHTVKGWTLGTGFEARNSTHQIKKIGEAELRAFRDLLELPISDKRLADAKPPYYHPGADSDEVEYLLMRRRALGGMLPRRVVRSKPLDLPGDATYAEFITGSGTRAASTTMVFAGLLRNLLRDPGVGNRIVPIIPDEARTFGMDALFSEMKIYAPFGQRYEPVDAGMVLSYREAVDGQILEEGITEAGSMGSFTAAGTAYATHGQAVIPFYIYYSMFGYQRVGDLIWAFGDSRGRGFMLGGTAGRTTLNGEGLQHEDGHSPLLFSAIPNVRIYDPAFAYELATVIRDGMRRMYVDGEDIFYYITLYNENYAMPPMPEGSEEGILRGLYRYRAAEGERTHHARILASGSAVQAAVEAQAMLLEQHDVAAEVWSATSFQLLRHDALEVERWNRLHPDSEPRVSYVDEQLGGADGPIVAVTDYMKAVPDQIGRFMTVPFIPLGTDGYGRSDTRVALRRHFEVDAGSISVAVLDGLARQERLPRHVVAAAIEQYGLDTELVDPRYR
jgi:pyruvate dehydrogenase E1 component